MAPAIGETYASVHTHAFVGQIANTEPQTLISRTVEDAAIPFGAAVAQGAEDYGVTLADTDGQLVRGVACRDQSADNADGVNDSFAVGESALVMTEGVIWVRAGGAVNAGDDVTYAIATQRFVTTAAGVGFLAVPGAMFETSGADGDIVAIRLTGTV